MLSEIADDSTFVHLEAKTIVQDPYDHTVVNKEPKTVQDPGLIKFDVAELGSNPVGELLRVRHTLNLVVC